MTPRRPKAAAMVVAQAAAVAIALAAATAITPPRPAAAQDGTARPRFSRSVTVTEAGWVRIPLDGATLARLQPDGGDLRLLGPDGQEIAYAWSSVPTLAPEREVAFVGAEALEGATRFAFDVGEVPPRHDRLSFLLTGIFLAAGVTIEGSDDGATWTPLGAGALFRLGDDPATALTGLDYPPTEARHLRMTWPAAAGLPPIERAWVRPVAPPRPVHYALRLDLSRPVGTSPRGQASGGDEVLLVIPTTTGLSGLDVRWQGGPSVGFALERAEGGGWTPAIEGLLQAVGSVGVGSIVVPPGMEPGTYRLLLWDGSADGPSVIDIAARLEPRFIDAYLEAPGTYALAYGAVGQAPTAYTAQPAPGEADIVPVLPGPERALPGPPLPAAALRLGGEQSTLGFTALYAVEAPAASEPGSMTQLELPDSAYAHGIGGDLRLIQEGRQVPYVRESPPDPAVVAEAVDASPSAFDRRSSAVTLTLPARALPLTQIELAAPAQPFEREVVVRTPSRSVLGRPPEFDVVASGSWQCAGFSALPCRLVLPVATTDATALIVTLHDGDNPPLAHLDARVYRQRDALRFPWPGDGLVLALGNPLLGAPRYDLALIADELALLDAALATARPLDGDTAAVDALEARTQPIDVERWVLVAALAVAGIGLLVVLRRTLGGETRGSER